MRNGRLASYLSKLEAVKVCYGRGCAAEVEKLLDSFKGSRFDGVESLIRFHDALLFLRAFPQSRRVLRLTEGLLAGIEQQVARLRDSGADMQLFDPEQASGIAGTIITDTFTYEVARWLARRYPKQLRVEWEIEEQARQMSTSLPPILPLLADDSLVEADTPYLDWMANAAGGVDQVLPWLMQRLEDAPMTLLQKTAWYDALKINVSWTLGDSAASRTRARRNPPQMYFHQEPLIRRNQVLLQDGTWLAALPMRRLSRSRR